MIDSILKGEIIKAVKPLAYSREIHGINLIVEVRRSDEEAAYAFLLAPYYTINSLIPEALVWAAISKYGYTVFEDQPLLVSKNELKEFLKNLKTE